MRRAFALMASLAAAWRVAEGDPLGAAGMLAGAVALLATAEG